MMSIPRVHGGTDAAGAARWDFSSNANATGPCPLALQAVQQAAAERYPDPAYTRLRLALADFHAVAPERVLLAASASECIQRITAWRWRAGDRRCWSPPHAYGDYAHAASVWGLARVGQASQAQLAWLCDPGSPLGQGESIDDIDVLLSDPCRTVVLDRAYAPLRLQGSSALSSSQLDRVWQLWSPNKALGLTGVRASYAIAPLAGHADVARLNTLAASWPIGAHGEAMLLAWTRPMTQSWLAQSLDTLSEWTGALRATLLRCGWTCKPSDTPYLCARPPRPLDAELLRTREIKLRDATSFGLPGWWRLSAQAPQALAALQAELLAAHRTPEVKA
jgi:histidinol-phosphate aminotransferase